MRLAAWMLVLATSPTLDLHAGATGPAVEKPLYCLAINIMFEAGLQPQSGQLAVGYSTINRVPLAKFPDTICDVVFDHTGRYCQYSWLCEPLKHPGRNPKTWEKSVLSACTILSNIRGDTTKGATHYHNHTVRPAWTSQFTRTMVLGDHAFYRAPSVGENKNLSVVEVDQEILQRCKSHAENKENLPKLLLEQFHPRVIKEYLNSTR